MKELINKIKKALKIHVFSCRYYSLTEWIRTLGGFMILLMIALMILFVFFRTEALLKLVFVNLLLIGGIVFIDNLTRKDND
jgi:predicted lipid-binding transport protein (Tim44 family)